MRSGVDQMGKQGTFLSKTQRRQIIIAYFGQNIPKRLLHKFNQNFLGG